jgi:hypothetical protein
MSLLTLGCPPYAVDMATEPGVYPGSDLLIDEWASAYLDTGLHWLDWLEQHRLGVHGVEQQLGGMLPWSERNA